MKIKDIISQGKVYQEIERIDFNVNQNKEFTIMDVVKAIDELKNKLLNSNDDYNNILFLMLTDKYLLEGIINNYNDGLSIIDSISKTIDFYREGLKNSNDNYLNQRIIDLDNLEYIIISALNNINTPKLNSDKIIITEEIYPSFLIDNINHIKGIISLRGGELAHTAILARAHRIPYVIVDELTFDYNMKYYINTYDSIVTKDYCDIEENNNTVEDIYELTKNSDIKIYSNVFSNDDLNKVVKYNYSGIGLYRTEFIFMNKEKPLSKHLQESIYKEAAQIMHPKPVVFRTFDVGDDKKLPYLRTKNKGVVNYINNIELFYDQIEALVKSNANNNVSIMFPMIRTIDEFNYLKNIVIDIAHKTDSNLPRIGMMLETKEAIHNLEQFKNVDFISLGTNDLTKELYNIDRDSISRKELYYDSLVKEITKVVSFCKSNDIKLSICGEIAHDEDVIESLMEAGITNFSVSLECFRPIIKHINRQK